MANKKTTPQGHPIKVVSRRTGLSSDVLRVWEKRYAAVTPQRVAGRRLYSDQDLERLMLLRRATLGGRPIGQVASLSTSELEQMAEEDSRAMLQAPGTPTVVAHPDTDLELDDTTTLHLGRTLKAVAAMDEIALRQALASASLALSSLQLIDELVDPLMKEIGKHWERGRLPIAHEHMASVVVRNFLLNVLNQQHHPSTAPAIIFCTPMAHRHELGALVAAVSAAVEGWRPWYLGTDLPASEIAAAAETKQANAVALSVTFSQNDVELTAELIELRRCLPTVPLLIGGASAAAQRTTLKQINAVELHDLASLRAVLSSLAGTTSAPPN